MAPDAIPESTPVQINIPATARNVRRTGVTNESILLLKNVVIFLL
jgi:hypothetical protein